MLVLTPSGSHGLVNRYDDTLLIGSHNTAANYLCHLRQLSLRRLSAPSSIPIICLTDNQSLFETVGTSNQILDRRLRVEVSAIREMIDHDEISIEWVCKEKQLSDVLTKKGASPMQLIPCQHCLSNLKLPWTLSTKS